MKLKIGHKLLAIREERAMTQAEMANLLDVSEASYSRYERNELQVPYSKMVKFAESLKVPVQEFLPDAMSINNQNHHHAGQGSGCIVFGTIYIGDSIANSQLAKYNEDLKLENKALQEKLEVLERKMEELLRKMG